MVSVGPVAQAPPSVGPAIQPTAVAVSSSRAQRIRDLVVGYGKAAHAQAWSVAVSIAGGPTFTFASGASPGTLFGAASITKVFTAAAILRLSETSALDLSGSIAAYEKTRGEAARITIFDLLTHRSGLPDFIMANGCGPCEDLDGLSASRQALLGDLLFEPGSTYSYSNDNYVLLGDVLQKATGQSYMSALDALVLVPNHLSPVSYGAPLEGDVAPPYAWKGGAYHLIADPWKPELTGAAGAIYTTATVVTGLTNALFADDRMLDASHLPPPGDSYGNLDARKAYALGMEVNINPMDGERYYDHTGAVPGYTSEMAYYPGEHIAIAVMCNDTLTRVQPLIFGIERIVRT